ncbi:hypothetical protein SK128_012543 [Halocaridina rubra]|uniref:Uncharacterized protein n=1 Tax=Halocaridina rubra TaxID=373956 RepID=A0AAN9AGB6_HALRR
MMQVHPLRRFKTHSSKADNNGEAVAQSGPSTYENGNPNQAVIEGRQSRAMEGSSCPPSKGFKFPTLMGKKEFAPLSTGPYQGATWTGLDQGFNNTQKTNKENAF